MEASLSHEEYMDWLAYFSEEGFEEDRQDVRHADLTATIMNSAGKVYKRHIKTSDLLLPKWETETQKKERTLKQQADADKAFGDKLMELQRMANN